MTNSPASSLDAALGELVSNSEDYETPPLILRPAYFPVHTTPEEEGEAGREGGEGIMGVLSYLLAPLRSFSDAALAPLTRLAEHPEEFKGNIFNTSWYSLKLSGRAFLDALTGGKNPFYAERLVQKAMPGLHPLVRSTISTFVNAASDPLMWGFPFLKALREGLETEYLLKGFAGMNPLKIAAYKFLGIESEMLTGAAKELGAAFEFPQYPEFRKALTNVFGEKAPDAFVKLAEKADSAMQSMRFGQEMTKDQREALTKVMAVFDDPGIKQILLQNEEHSAMAKFLEVRKAYSLGLKNPEIIKRYPISVSEAIRMAGDDERKIFMLEYPGNIIADLVSGKMRPNVYNNEFGQVFGEFGSPDFDRNFAQHIKFEIQDMEYAFKDETKYRMRYSVPDVYVYDITTDPLKLKEKLGVSGSFTGEQFKSLQKELEKIGYRGIKNGEMLTFWQKEKAFPIDLSEDWVFAAFKDNTKEIDYNKVLEAFDHPHTEVVNIADGTGTWLNDAGKVEGDPHSFSVLLRTDSPEVGMAKAAQFGKENSQWSVLYAHKTDYKTARAAGVGPSIIFRINGELTQKEIDEVTKHAGALTYIPGKKFGDEGASYIVMHHVTDFVKTRREWKNVVKKTFEYLRAKYDLEYSFENYIAKYIRKENYDEIIAKGDAILKRNGFAEGLGAKSARTRTLEEIRRNFRLDGGLSERDYIEAQKGLAAGIRSLSGYSETFQRRLAYMSNKDVYPEALEVAAKRMLAENPYYQPIKGIEVAVDTFKQEAYYIQEDERGFKLMAVKMNGEGKPKQVLGRIKDINEMMDRVNSMFFGKQGVNTMSSEIWKHTPYPDLVSLSSSLFDYINTGGYTPIESILNSIIDRNALLTMRGDELLENLKNAIRGGIEDVMRRGVVHDKDALTTAMTQSIETTLGLIPGRPMSYEESIASAIGIEQLSNLAYSLSKAAVERGGDEERRLAAVAIHRLAEAVFKFEGHRAEAGRIERIMRMFKTPLEKQIAVLRGTLASMSVDGTTEDILAAFISKMDRSSQAGRFIAQLTKKPDWSDVIYELFVNNILSRPLTHITNTVSNSTVLTMWPIEEGMGGLVAIAHGDIEIGKTMLKQSAMMIYTAMKTIKDAIKVAIKTRDFNATLEAMLPETYLKELLEISEFAQKVKPQNISAKTFGFVGLLGDAMDALGEMVRTPGRALVKEDLFFKALASRMEMTRETVAKALESSVTARQFADEYMKAAGNPLLELRYVDKKAVVNEAAYRTFNNPGGAGMKAFSDFVVAAPGMRWVFPFTRTPLNIIKFGMERTPFGLLFSDIRRAFLKGGIESYRIRGKIALGTLVPAMLLYFFPDNIIGKGPENPELKRFWEQSGKIPYSIRVGNQVFGFKNFEPIRQLFGLMSNIKHAFTMLDMQDPEDVDIVNSLVATVVGAFWNHIDDSNFLRSFTTLLDGVENLKRLDSLSRTRGLTKYLERQIANVLIPGLFQQATQLVTDPYFRIAESFSDQVMKSVPGWSQKLPVYRNLWGDPSPIPDRLGPDIISPVLHPHYDTDPVAQEIMRLQVPIPRLTRYINGVKLDKWQYDRLAEFAGKGNGQGPTLHDAFEQMMASGEWNLMTDEQKREYIVWIINQYRDMARQLLIVSDDDLRAEIMERQQKGRQPAL